MLERLMNNPFAWLILSIISVGSFIFGVYTWLIGKKKKEISTSQFSYEIIKAGKRQIPKVLLSDVPHTAKIGLEKGTTLTTEKSVKAKEIIKKHATDFGGTLSDKDVMTLCKVSRNTYYKYKRELKLQL